jgi:hypothetical protein
VSVLLIDRITKVLEAELNEHGVEDDDEKRWQVARHWAERIVEALQLTEQRWHPESPAGRIRWATPWVARWAVEETP